MAIAEDASTPAVATGTGTAALTTASFSPPAGSLLVALIGGGWSNSRITTAITDSVGGTWTPGVIANDITGDNFYGYAAVYLRYLPSAPGAMTVTATYSGFSGSGAGGRQLAVRVLTGASSVQTGAATAKLALDSSTSSLTASIATTTAGSVVFGVADDARRAETMSASANTSLCSANGGTNPFSSSFDTVTLAAFKQTSATGSPGSLSLGVSLSASSNQGEIALFEVIPTGGTPVSKVPLQRTWTTGEVVADSHLDRDVRDAVNFLLAPPHAVVASLSSTFTVPSATSFNLITAWDTSVSDSDSMWSPSAPSRLTARTAGLYVIAAYVHFPTPAAGSYGVGLALNNNGGAWGGSTRINDDLRPGTTGPLGTSSTIVATQFLNVGDYVEAYVEQNTGASQTIPNNLFSAQFSALWVASS